MPRTGNIKETSIDNDANAIYLPLIQEIQMCENCWEINNIQHSYCTNCWESLQTSCRECQHKYSKSYSYCPNCWAPSLEE